MSGPCWLTGDDPVMTAYHDQEWGRPVTGERELYERMCLEGFQSGLSWRTVLNKRPAFREVFAGFDPEKVAAFRPQDVDRLLQDARIIRHRRKIEATITNARAVLALHESGTELRDMFWGYAPGPDTARRPAVLSELPATTPEALELSKRLRKLGFAFVGPTTAYASMQACGIVNDHLTDCPFRDEVEQQRRESMDTFAPRKP
ncbi:MAG TPA: DNA-3-methyladenine glycosylase I [Frankiaceae bacterium]|jgi:DNA-3-methyladenine glycosylase I|nr:DNA-3-methyladenine glycosylase I [Frankiaceae bacterium]